MADTFRDYDVPASMILALVAKPYSFVDKATGEMVEGVHYWLFHQTAADALPGQVKVRNAVDFAALEAVGVGEWITFTERVAAYKRGDGAILDVSLSSWRPWVDDSAKTNGSKRATAGAAS